MMRHHLHMPSYFLGTFTEYPYLILIIPEYLLLFIIFIVNAVFAGGNESFVL